MKTSDGVHLEQELKLQATRRFDLAALADGVDGLAASPLETKKVSTVYYDTDDLRLTRWGTSLRFRRGEGWTVKFGTDDTNGALIRTEHRFTGPGAKPPAAALELLRAFLRGRDVKPVARLRTIRKSLLLRGATGEPVAEVADDDVRVVDGGRIVDRFRELEVELVNGAPISLLDGLRASLQRAGAGPVDPTPKNVRALGPAALAPSELDLGSPDADSTAADIIRSALAASVEMLLRCDAPLRVAMDPETVHQARVATRKLRSDLRTFMPLLREDWARALRAKIVWLSDEFGAVRDADVLVARLRQRAERLPEKDAPAARAILEVFVKQCTAARRGLAKIVREQRYEDLLEELVDAAADPRLERHASAPALAELPSLVEERWRKLCKAVEELGEEADDEQLHRLRIKAKRCRYAAEAIVPIGGKPVARFARRVQRLQKILGDLHDAVVAEERLHEIEGDRQTVFVAGALAAMESIAAEEARSTWRKAWRKAAKKSLRSWMS
ncbi:MAG TPA: CHAD domain-containing protein [Candidatus Acidoferrales bacterium]|nr:CHAD domain-containing protein [Candidatus Acidoferrales bacterium]